MQATNNDNPVLNNPYEEPKYYYDTVRGNLDYSKVLKGRRPYMGNIDITPSATRGEGEFFSDSDFADASDPNVPFINSIRAEVKKWRKEGYPKTTRITRNLLNFWFVEPRQNNLRLFFCQREAVETAVYLNEVADLDPNVGRYLLHQLDERLSEVSDDTAYQLPRTAFKMATGTGKTVVMAMLILYNYLNKQEYHNDTRFVDHFVLVTPGVTIRERLGVLYIDPSHTSIYDRHDYYHQRGLIPHQYEQQLGGLNACIQILNYQQLEPKMLKGKHESPMDGKLHYTEEGKLEKLQVKESYANLLGRLLKGMKGKRIVVINDEAHHCYLPKNWESSNDEEASEGVEENKYAMIWYEGLRQMKLCGYKIQHVYDLSATPYYRKGSGYQEYSLFPWVVSDFGLVEAIESGLVKIPFFPAFDTTADEEPKFKHIYQHIRADIPKKGMRGKRKQEREEGKEQEKESAPQIPALLRTALDQFYKDYEDYERGLRGSGESAKNIFSTPPVFIVVCNNTFFSKEVYKELAGWETTNEEGEPERHPSKYDLFSNYDPTTGLPRPKSPTLLVDSVALDAAADVVDEDFKRIYAKEIEDFKRDYATKNGSGNVDKLKDSDIMREIVNSVGKQGTLGADIRCVVSVGMLTEGWDANTVTHVCGVRAFGSQLLCEQVVGRALRRRSYDLVAYDKEGREIPEENIRRYKPENITYKFPPEYAHIIGVPFKNFKGGNGTPPPPPKPKTEIRALEERREQFEIKFPVVIGYKSESIDEKIEADYKGVVPFVIDFRSKIPHKTHLASPINDKDVIMQTDVERLRDHFIIFYLTQLVISEKYSVNGPQFQKFNQLKEIVDYWYYHQIQVIGGNDDMRRFVIMYDAKEVVASIYAGIHQHNVQTGHVRLSPILNFYNPESSTRYVRGYTSKPTVDTMKSHVNKVAAEDGSWQQVAVKALEKCEQVKSYVRNQYLEFYIPYLEGTTERNYMPDFIAVVQKPDGDSVHVLIEISHFPNCEPQKRETILRYVCDYWIEAVNNLGKYGQWAMVEIGNVDNMEETLTNNIENL